MFKPSTLEKKNQPKIVYFFVTTSRRIQNIVLFLQELMTFWPYWQR